MRDCSAYAIQLERSSSNSCAYSIFSFESLVLKKYPISLYKFSGLRVGILKRMGTDAVVVAAAGAVVV